MPFLRLHLPLISDDSTTSGRVSFPSRVPFSLAAWLNGRIWWPAFAQFVWFCGHLFHFLSSAGPCLKSVYFMYCTHYRSTGVLSPVFLMFSLPPECSLHAGCISHRNSRISNELQIIGMTRLWLSRWAVSGSGERGVMGYCGIRQLDCCVVRRLGGFVCPGATEMQSVRSVRSHAKHGNEVVLDGVSHCSVRPAVLG